MKVKDDDLFLSIQPSPSLCACVATAVVQSCAQKDDTEKNEADSISFLFSLIPLWQRGEKFREKEKKKVNSA